MRELVTMSWGFVLLREGYAPKRVTNTRDDKLASRFWRKSFEERRCLVPATAFCEPHDGRKPATWHWFALKGNEPRPSFAFAGVWQRWKGPVKKDGTNVEIDVYSFMTTVPNTQPRVKASLWAGRWQASEFLLSRTYRRRSSGSEPKAAR
jgi:putative SOS response-associated peptidase YedK